MFQHEQTMNSSFDDLPPPPPPISSSPAPPDDDAEEVRFRQKIRKKWQKFPPIVKFFSISRSLRVITAALWPPHRSRCRSREAVFGGTNTSTFQSLNGSVSVLEVLEVFWQYFPAFRRMNTSLLSWQAKHIYNWCSCILLSATISGTDLSWLGMLSFPPSHSLLAVQLQCTLYDLLYDHWSWSLLCSMHHTFENHSAYSKN